MRPFQLIISTSLALGLCLASSTLGAHNYRPLPSPEEDDRELEGQAIKTLRTILIRQIPEAGKRTDANTVAADTGTLTQAEELFVLTIDHISKRDGADGDFNVSIPIT
ncbi:hypothetical protein GQ54DRAFT_224714 [Martensiomyces pterosporus]|nr:hypothetical protein GQ54DRAFT_224714 [Martensiomyces pterosporus]